MIGNIRLKIVSEFPSSFPIPLTVDYKSPIKQLQEPSLAPLPYAPGAEKYGREWFLKQCEMHLPADYSLQMFSSQVLNLLMAEDTGILMILTTYELIGRSTE